MKTSRLILGASLFALSVLFSLWFHDDRNRVAALLVFTLPPLLLLVGVIYRSAKAAFWAGVLALFWFSHGVMLAYDDPDVRVYAWIEILLAIVIILSSNWPGLSSRFGRKQS